jgi:hypothetical protein
MSCAMNAYALLLAVLNCTWLFDKATLKINGMPTQMNNRPSRAYVRRVYVGKVRKVVSIPTNMQVNIPVRLPLSSWHTPECDWLIEYKQIRPGLFATRTLLSGSNGFTSVRFVHVSGVDQMNKCRAWRLPNIRLNT